MSALTLFFALSWVGQGPMASGPNPDDCLLTDRQAFLLLPPQPVGPGQTTSMKWSPSGRFLLLTQDGPRVTPTLIKQALLGERPARPTRGFVAWDRHSGKSADLGTLPPSWNGIEPTFIGKNDVVACLVDADETEAVHPVAGRPEQSLLAIDLQNSARRTLPLAPADATNGLETRLFADSMGDRLLVVQNELPDPKLGSPQPRFVARIWTLDGQMRPSIRLELGRGYVRFRAWAKLGQLAEISVLRFDEIEKPREEKHYYDMATGKLGPKPEGQPPAKSVLPFDVQFKPAKSGEASFMAAWLRSNSESEQRECLVAGQATEAELAPGAEAVAILDRGLVTVRLITAIPREAYLAARRAAEKARVMSTAKQIGTAFLMFATDHDDRLPSSSEFGSGEIDRYLKIQGFTNGFTYLQSGGSLVDIDNPAGTVLGYLPGPGGYAWVFADGHVRWNTDPPKPPQVPRWLPNQ